MTEEHFIITILACMVIAAISMAVYHITKEE